VRRYLANPQTNLLGPFHNEIEIYSLDKDGEEAE